MSCTTHEEGLALHASDALEGEARQALETHLRSCPSCAAELTALRALLVELQATAPRPGPAGAFVAATVEAATRSRRTRRLVRSFGLAGLGVAAAAAAAAWLLLAPAQTPAQLLPPGDDAAWLAALGDEDGAEDEDELTTLGLDEFDDDALDELVELAEG